MSWWDQPVNPNWITVAFVGFLVVLGVGLVIAEYVIDKMPHRRSR